MSGSRRVRLKLAKVKGMLRRERRKNRRLREVIDGLRGQIADHRRDLDLHFRRLAQLQAELDALKQSTRR